MEQVVIGIIVALAALFAVCKFGGFLSKTRGKGGCGHCGCGDKSSKKLP